MDVESIARTAYIVSAFLMTFGIGMLYSSWRRLVAIMNTMPADKRRVRFKFGGISDQNERLKYTYILVQFIACGFLAICFFGALTGFVVMSDIILGRGGPYVMDDFELAFFAVHVARLCLLMGMFSLGMVYVEDLIALYRGEKSITMTNLRELPARRPPDKARSKMLFISLLAFVVAIGLINILVPYNQWVKMGFALVAGIGILAVGNFVYRTYRRVRNK